MGFHDVRIYIGLFKRIVRDTLLQNRSVKLISAGAILSTLVASYFTVELPKTTTKLTKEFNGNDFERILNDFLFFSFVLLLFQITPRMIFNYVQQSILRAQFLRYVKEYMQRSYVSFSKKTPGEMRYLIFIKALASTLITQIILFDLAMVSGTTLFSIRNIVNKGSLLSGFIFLIVPVLYLSAVFYYLSKRNTLQYDYLKRQEFVSSKLYDKLLNYEIIKAYNLEHAACTAFFRELAQQERAQSRMARFEAWGKFVLNMIQLLPYLVLVGFAFIESEKRQDQDTLDLLKTTMMYFTLCAQLKILGSQVIDMVFYLYQIKFAEVEDNLETESRSRDILFIETIEFRGVTLLHHDSAIVSDINLTIRRGEKVAVIGPNGSGKSTFVKSLLGFTKFNGQILVDGHPTDEIGWEAVRKLISYVPQDDYTSDDTVMNNLLLGRPGSSREYIESKARAFGAHETFASLENGYDTEVGARGNRLSGGQRQKLSLVRAGVRDGAIFILDEATASMDKQYEKEVVELLFSYLKEKTVVMIVHGKEYLKRFDRLILLKDGRVEDVGSYDEIRRRSPWFRDFIAC